MISGEDQMDERIQMPQLKADMKAGVIKKWLKQPGDRVAKGEGLFTVADGKLVKTVSAAASGVLKECSAAEGDSVACGEQVALIRAEEAACGGEAREVELRMPKIGTSGEGSIKKWFKKAGDPVAPGDMIFSMSAGKLVQNVTSQWSGTVVKLLAQPGNPDPAGEVVAVLTAGAEGGTDTSGQEKSVLVVGGGPGGYVAAIRAAQLGARVCLVEKGTIGGTCLNVGCIPTKALLHSAEVYHTAMHAGRSGVTASGVTLHWDQVQENRRRISKTLSGGVSGLLDMNGVEVLSGAASFLAPDKLQVCLADGTKREMTADRIILATGSAPAMPPIPGITGNPDCVDSTGALQLETLPSSMVFIGGGVISVELACAYARFGTQVTVVEMLPRLLPPMDGELTELAKQCMEREGIRFCMETQVTSIEKQADGSVVHGTKKDGTAVSFRAEKIVVAVGRRSYTEGLNPEAAGITMQRGRILVNDAMETSVPGIYAIGDCNGKLMLAHTASCMGETAAENAMGGHARFDGKSTPSCVYCFPEFAGAGMTGEEAEASGQPLMIGRFPMMANGKSLIMESTEGMVKIIANRRTRRVLGVHILGARATDLIAEAALAIETGVTVDQMISTIHAHPTVAESVREAALAAEGRAIHIHEN